MPEPDPTDPNLVAGSDRPATIREMTVPPGKIAGLEHVVVHDFSGHPFQVQLARHLAERGVRVTHLYCPSFNTPRGNVDGSEPGKFESRGIPLTKWFAKYSGARRLKQELEYGWRLGREVRALRPQVVVSSNTPLIAALLFQAMMKVSRIPVVFWQQDVYSAAMSRHIGARLGVVGRAVGSLLPPLEGWLLRSSKAVVVISEDFLPALRDWRVDSARTTVIENWAPLEELPVRPRRNQWSERHGLAEDDIVFLYAGTLGIKHQPSMLLDLARAFGDRADVRVIVASEGIGANWLKEHAGPDDGLELLEFQPYEDLPDMLASADVLLVLLEPDAGHYSVPSKVLTYHCAGRAILASMPADNLASRNIVATGSGIVVAPSDSGAFVEGARALAADPERRRELGAVARQYAERTFDIDHIVDRFESILATAVGR